MRATVGFLLTGTTGGLSIVGGQGASGVTFCGGGEPLQDDDWEFDATQSITLWPSKIRASFEHDALFAVAGDVAVRCLSGRRLPSASRSRCTSPPPTW